jgi:hypothetical protein
MQQPFPPAGRSEASGHFPHSQPSACGCSGVSSTPPVDDTGNYPNHGQFQHPYLSAEQYPAYNQGYLSLAMPGSLSSWFNFSDHVYLKGFIAGAAVTFVLSNPSMKKGLIRGLVNLTSMVQGGVEEVKEQVQDIKAEMGQKEA